MTVVSDGVTTLHGIWDAPPEWFSSWKSIDGQQVEPGTTASMKTLAEGLFRKDRLLEVFGDLIHTYDIKQSQEDRATVPIYYAPRQVRLHLTHADVDAALQEITAGQTVADLERRKSRWAALAKAAGAKERIEEVARDLLTHFQERTATLDGKALVVCMTRENCVRLRDALTALPGCPEVKVVMTGNLAEDPPEWSRAGHITTKPQRDAIKARMVDPDDPLKIAIVCDMWLTGTDIPCLHTLYLDKPMRGHTIIQAISRVNRVFRDKPHGLILDYIGIADELREATGQYSQGGGRGSPAPGVSEEAKPLFLEALAAVREMLPEGHEYGAWRRLSPRGPRGPLRARLRASRGDRRAPGRLPPGRAASLSRVPSRQASRRVPTPCGRGDLLPARAQGARQDAARRQARQGAGAGGTGSGRRQRGVAGRGDIFKVAGIERADISILDDTFLQTFKDRPLADLRLRLLAKLVADEIQARQRRNLVQSKSFKDLLEQTLQRYHNRLIDAAAVIKAMIEIRQGMDRAHRRAAQLGLEADELAFYEAVAAQRESAYGAEFLRDLIHDVVQVIKRTVKVDWTAPHRDDVKAAVRAAVRRVLRTRQVRAEDFEPFLAAVMAQAEALYADWPLAA